MRCKRDGGPENNGWCGTTDFVNQRVFCRCAFRALCKVGFASERAGGGGSYFGASFGACPVMGRLRKSISSGEEAGGVVAQGGREAVGDIVGAALLPVSRLLVVGSEDGCLRICR